jgi:hypothetical protein
MKESLDLYIFFLLIYLYKNINLSYYTKYINNKDKYILYISFLLIFYLLFPYNNLGLLL